MVTPTELGQVSESNNMALANGPEKPVSATPDPSGLANLAERLEQAKIGRFGSEVLNRAIGKATGIGGKPGRLHGKNFTIWPNFTVSIDAALLLVPDGWFWMAGRRDKNRCRAYVNNGESHFVGIAARPNPAKQWFECLGETPAIALCAAALKARSAQVDRNPEGEKPQALSAKHESPVVADEAPEHQGSQEVNNGH